MNVINIVEAWAGAHTSASIFKRYYKSHSGLVLLEYAGIVMITLPLLMMAVDAINLLRVKSALKESTNQTLRCLTPSDADCHTKPVDNQIGMYEVDINNSRSAWPLENFLYSAESEWLGLPQTRYQNPEARVLDRVNYQRRLARAYVHEAAQDLRINLNYYVQRAIVPFVTTGSNTTQTLNPRFNYKHSRGRSYTADVIKSISNIDGSVSKRRVNNQPYIKHIGRASFSAPLMKSIPCYRSNRLDKAPANHLARFNQNCSNQMIPTLLHITGSFPADAAAEGSDGTVYIKLSGGGFKINAVNGGTGAYNLGGRSFRYQDAGDIFANFIPRGVGATYYSASNGYLEFDKYKNIKLTAGRNYNIDFYIQRTSDRASKTRWKGKQLKVYFGKYREVTASSICSRNQIRKLGTQLVCQEASFQSQSLPAALLNNTTAIPYTVTTAHGCVQSLNDVEKCPTCTATLNFSDNTCNSRTVPARATCPSNYGVRGNPNTNPESARLCPVTDSLWHSGHVVTYTEKLLGLGQYRVDYTRLNCTAPAAISSANYPGNLSRYKKLGWRNISQLADQKLYTGERSAREFKQEYSEYDCSEINEHRQSHDYHQLSEDSIPDSVKDSLLYGNQNILTTGCDWEDSVKDSAISALGLEHEIYLKAKRKFSTVSYTEDEPGGGCYNLLPQHTQGETNIASGLGPFELDQLPSECNQPEFSCDIKLVGFEGSPNDNFLTDTNMAANRGYRSFKVAYPQAKFTCQEGLDCYKMDIDFDGTDFNVVASMDVPLLWTLGNYSKTIEVQNAGRYEGYYLRPRS